MAERRQVDRLKCTSGALIFSDRQRGVHSCALRDISDTGVGLRLNHHDAIAPVFKMTLDNFRNVWTCQVVWSRGRYVGATVTANQGTRVVKFIAFGGGGAGTHSLPSRRHRRQNPQGDPGRRAT